MATVYSSEVAVGTYNRIRIKCDYSGTSATLTIQFRRTSGYSTTWYDDGAQLVFNGQTKSANYSYTGYVGTDWVTLRPAISGYTISTSGGTYSWDFTSPLGGVLACSGSLTIPGQSSAPTGLTASNLVPGVEGFTADVSITGWGTGGSTSDRRKELQCWTYNATTLTQPRRYNSVWGESLTTNISVNNYSTISTDAILHITGNTIYTLGLYATNGAASTGSVNWMPAVTLPYEPILTSKRIEKTSATFKVDIHADGGFYEKDIYYSIDNGANWIYARKITSGDATTFDLELNNLSASTQYTLKVRSTTPAGDSVSKDYVFTTSATTPCFYGSDNIQRARETVIFYGSSNSVARNIVKTYCSVNGRAVPCFIKHV